MKKHWLACLLALALSALCLMPTQARAATETHSGHCICGAEHRSVGGHKIDATNNWNALTVDQNGCVTWPTERSPTRPVLWAVVCLWDSNVSFNV